jgi:indole-3-glycerol phosphate synthase
MRDFLDELAETAKETLHRAYYESAVPTPKRHVSVSLKQTILQCSNVPVITEIKGTSPSRGIIRAHIQPEKLAAAMVKGGASGISVLTEPKHFKGSLGYLAKVRDAVSLPILMKDFILSPVQLDAAARVGANAVLLIQALFDRGYCECGVYQMIAAAHKRNLEVLLETHSEDEFQRAVQGEADLVGINNRDLGTLHVDVNVTKRILSKCDSKGKVVVSESGINSPEDIQLLRAAGAKAFLVGSAVMLSADVEAKVRELTQPQSQTLTQETEKPQKKEP